MKPHIKKQWGIWFCMDAKDDCWPAFGGANPTIAYLAWRAHKLDIGEDLE